jgi:hypothetical protein
LHERDAASRVSLFLLRAHCGQSGQSHCYFCIRILVITQLSGLVIHVGLQIKMTVTAKVKEDYFTLALFLAA